MGYQNVQSTHSIADFIFEYPEQSKIWKETSNSIICLGVKNEEELLRLYDKFKTKTQVTIFSEPDINNEYTSLCLFGTPEIRKKLSNLPLLGKQKYSLSDIHMKMINTEQTKGQSVLEHGLSVSKQYKSLLEDIKNNNQGIIPNHIFEYKDFILENLFDDSIMEKYHVYHDMGKPFVITHENNKVHFPNHAEYSSILYKEIFSNDKDVDIVSTLIKHDMDFHILKCSQYKDYLDNTVLDKRYIVSLLTTTLAELFSNAKMFGGYESDSFKIKFKNYSKLSQRILKSLANNY